MSTELRGSRRRKGCEKARLHRKKSAQIDIRTDCKAYRFQHGKPNTNRKQTKRKTRKRDMKKKLAVESYPNYFFGKITEEFGCKTVLEEIGNKRFFVFG